MDSIARVFTVGNGCKAVRYDDETTVEVRSLHPYSARALCFPPFRRADVVARPTASSWSGYVLCLNEPWMQAM
ncbi:unnamed protein product [Heligmosomoides polygyrus]|uniref:Tudor domain-containing protein n=1 Tax=Heligmosomoides polygyrus TaxID=6339 RepID=A0A183GAQ4_HELPZ|nr:unnamed protein product [Heligmosomoides polygyrus]